MIKIIRTSVFALQGRKMISEQGVRNKFPLTTVVLNCPGHSTGSRDVWWPLLEAQLAGSPGLVQELLQPWEHETGCSASQGNEAGPSSPFSLHFLAKSQSTPNEEQWVCVLDSRDLLTFPGLFLCRDGSLPPPASSSPPGWAFKW